jgi:hypothetical protein
VSPSAEVSPSSGAHAGAAAIQVRIQSIGQLFHTLDPLPFRERDLDAGVEEYIVGWAGELSGAHPLEVVIHLPPAEVRREEAGHLEDAVHNYFSYRAEVTGWELRDLFRLGRASLAIGIGVLAACIVLGKLTSGWLGGGYLGRFFDEGLIILGWVANWRPVEILLYDWWPIVRRRRLYRRLAAAKVRIVESEGPGLAG